ncbi:unnamed protein product [Polarella glacialis]|uniref:Calmodulin n=1 Tax=Polarella glacialis TaxID=89957 RepID=A0A813D796_POLGL|nr:unnamed protein product [Polarella glacialis]
MIDGSVVTWGDDAEGGDSSGVASLLTEGVIELFSNYKDFVALKADGSVVTWGDDDQGGDSSEVAALLTEGVVHICGIEQAFAAIKARLKRKAAKLHRMADKMFVLKVSMQKLRGQIREDTPTAYYAYTDTFLFKSTSVLLLAELAIKFDQMRMGWSSGHDEGAEKCLLMGWSPCAEEYEEVSEEAKILEDEEKEEGSEDEEDEECLLMGWSPCAEDYEEVNHEAQKLEDEEKEDEDESEHEEEIEKNDDDEEEEEEEGVDDDEEDEEEGDDEEDEDEYDADDEEEEEGGDEEDEDEYDADDEEEEEGDDEEDEDEYDADDEEEDEDEVHEYEEETDEEEGEEGADGKEKDEDVFEYYKIVVAEEFRTMMDLIYMGPPMYHSKAKVTKMEKITTQPTRNAYTRYQSTCLVDALRSLGKKVPYQRDGPFWALKDGNYMLIPFQVGWQCDRKFASFAPILNLEAYDIVYQLKDNDEDGHVHDDIDLDVFDECEDGECSDEVMSEFESCFSEYDQEVFGSGDGQDYLGGGEGLILPPLVAGDKSQTIPEPPVDFVHGIIPAVEGSLLKNMHLHIRDNALTFEPVAHKYFINGVPTIGSVTGLLHDFVNEFNADTAIQMMRRSRNWPRAEYLQDGLPMTDEQIKSKWEHNRVDAANQGTYMTEWMIYGEDLNLAGSIDFVATRSDGALVLFDWKRTKELHTKYSNRFQSMTGPLSHLADCVPILEDETTILIRHQFSKTISDDYLDYLGAGDEDPEFDFERQLAEEMAYNDETPIAEAPVRLSQAKEEQAEPETVGILNQVFGIDNLELTVITEEADEVAEDTESGGVGTARRKRRLIKGASTSSSDFSKMFSSYLQSATAALDTCVKTIPTTQATIVNIAKRLTTLIRADHPQWSDRVVRLGVAALSFYRMRPTDMCAREHCLLLWIAEGGNSMRAHKGSCYIYNDVGSFTPYKGIPPETTCARMKDFILQLEGLFRRLPQGLKREDSELLKAVDTLLLEDESEVTFVHKCTDAALFNLGDDRLKPSRGQFDDDAGSGPPSSWPIWIAQALRKVGMQVQRELLEGRLLTYFIEWCDPPVSKKAGVCYADTCILYDVSDSLLVHHVEPSPKNDIYVYIPTPLLDPVLESMVARLLQFFSQTFWCNFEVFQCTQAAQALCKRGENLDRCFIGESPGGVGQSLFTAHLAAVYKHNHSYFDPNVWYMDEELRKQIEEFADSFILTGQEAPNGTRQLREDLFKKTMSADGIPGRKPYGLQTRMLELIGWKRLELNKMLRFGSVTESNFNSILRRCFVWKPKARFWDRDYLKNNYPDSHLDGIFPKCAELRTFLVSPAAIAASLRIQYGFEQKHSKEGCRQIENYVVLGGDEGMTEERMRFACGKPWTRYVIDLRLFRKHSDDEPKKEFHAQHTNYKYVGLPTTRGRRYVVGTGAQSLSRRLQRVAFPHTMDLDQVNSVFVILDQLLDKLEISTVIPNDIRKVIQDCAHRREQVCRDDLQTDISTGKQLLHSVLHGGLLKTPHESNAFLQKLQKASIYLRWLACSIMPDAYEFYCNQPDKKFPECTVLQHLCTIVEDHIMEALTDFIRFHPVQHLSLHFDGIRLNVDYRLNVDEPQDVDILMRLAENHIAEATGFLVQFKVKRHQYLSELINEHTVSKTKVDVPHIFLKRGNCIPLALAHITGQYQHIQTGLSDTDNRDNMYAASRFSRTYRQALTLTHCKLVPHTGFAIDADGVYLLHTDGAGSPHCIGVTVKDAKSSVIIWDGEEQFALPWSEFNLIVNSAIDASSFITFRVFSSADACIWPTDIDKADLETLLELQAGGTKAGSTLKRPSASILKRPSSSSSSLPSEEMCSDAEECELDEFDATHPDDESVVVVDAKLLSAQLLREHVVPALDSAHNEIDRNIRMILDDKVVKFVNAESLKSMSLRRVGNLLYTQSFAEMLFQEIIVCNCKISAAIPRLLMHMHQAGCQLGNLLPVHTRYWWPIVEDIVMSPGVETLRLKLLDELESHTEYTAISVDATLRCCMPVMGQSNHRNAVLRLSDSAFDDADSLRRVLSIKGRTGAVVALLPIVSEKAECVAQAIADNLTKKAKEQVKYFFCDNPSPKLCSALSDILPIFEGMCLDPVHLPITYEYSTWSASSCATHGAFAAILAGGSVVTWGDSERGADSSAVAALLTEGVVQVVATDMAFAALKANGSVVTWGKGGRGGDSSSVAALLAEGVAQVCGNVGAFVARLSNGSVVTWGSPHFGGDSSKVAQHLTEGVVQVCGTNTACAALMIDGSVVTWGDDAEGGDSSGVASLLTEGVIELFSNYKDFVALKADGSVVFWGDTGSWSHDGDIVSVCGSGGAFAAIRQNGCVVTWGDDDQGGDSSEVAALLTAFAAIKADGSVVTWGQQVVGGDSSAVAHLLKEGVTAIF